VHTFITNNQNRAKAGKRGFSLLEVTIATALFSLAVMSLAQSMLYSIEAQNHMETTQHLRRAVTQHAEAILASPGVPVSESFAMEDDGAFAGIEIEQEVETVVLKPEIDLAVDPQVQETGLTEVTAFRVRLTGKTDPEMGEATYSLTFYVLR